jgi:LL-diaminopimelate aminotransferase
MVKINGNYLKLKKNYLFSEIAKRVSAYQSANQEAKLLRLGIGDVVLPLSPAIVAGLNEASSEMSRDASFKGYGPEQGYGFLRDLITKNEYNDNGITIDADEIFISDGSKCDTGNIQEIFSLDAKVAVTDPVYPVYVDTNLMAGRDITYLACTKENNFAPSLPTSPVDLIYLCFPNNPTGTTITKAELKTWVDYAAKNDAIILYDAAYEAFITEDDVAHSIYEIEGADKVAIEFRSFSKNAGFTGTRLGFTVVPKALKGVASDGSEQSIHALWNRRQSTKFNGASYVIQKAGAAAYSEQGQKEIKGLVDYYMENAKIIKESLEAIGLKVTGGINAPYIWIETPDKMSSWDFFDLLLNKTQIIGTPGSGFGSCGEGFFRLSAFCQRENVIEAMARIKERMTIAVSA